MSAHPIVPRNAEACPSDIITLCLEKPALVTNRAASAATRDDESLLGSLGVIVILAILLLGVYSVVRYLF
jgi:hypothetical protein